MAINDVKVVKNPGSTQTWDTQDRTSSSQTTQYLPGEPLKVSGNYLIALATGDPEVGTDEFVGICRKQSTELAATTDGKVEVISLLPVATVLRANVTTTTNLDSASELLGVMGDWIAFDVTGAGTNGSTGVFTFDENEGSDPNVQGLKVIGGDYVKNTLDCIVHANATQAAPLTGQTMDG